MTFKQKLTIDAIGFETGGDDNRYPDRTPRTVKIGYYNNGNYTELGTFSLEDLVGRNYAKKKFPTQHIEADSFDFYFSSSPNGNEMQLGEIVFYFWDQNADDVS